MGDSCIQEEAIDAISGKKTIPLQSPESALRAFKDTRSPCPGSFQEEKLELIIHGSTDTDKMLRKSIANPCAHDSTGFVGRLAVKEGLAKTTEDEILLLKAQLLDDHVGEATRSAAILSTAEINGNQETATETTHLLAGQSQSPLTILIAIRGCMSLVVLVTTSFMLLVFLAPVGFGILRFFSVHLTREISAFVFGNWLSMWPVLIEKINGTKIIFAGDRVPKGERVLVLCNHRTEVDWMYIWNLALRKDRIGYVKYMLKSSVRNWPIFGWGFHILEFMFLARDWKVDEPVIKSYTSSFQDPRDPLWLILFPEGTDFTEAKKLKSQQFAEMQGLKKLNNVLLPRTKGFVACLSDLRISLDAVYDLTIGYKYRCPTFYDNLFGVDPPEVHIHVRRIPLDQIPVGEDTSTAWLQELFYRKDQLLEIFNQDGYFPNSGVEGNLDIRSCSKKILAVFLFTVIFMALAIVTSLWIKVYVVLSCVYLTTVTYFNWKPTPFFTRGEWARGLKHER